MRHRVALGIALLVFTACGGDPGSSTTTTTTIHYYHHHSCSHIDPGLHHYAPAADGDGCAHRRTPGEISP